MANTNNNRSTGLQRTTGIPMSKGESQLNGWSLRVAGSNLAELVFSPGRQEAMRIAIAACDSDQAWNIQLNRSCLTVVGGLSYRVRFEARGDQSRDVSIGVAMAHEPWASLGLYHTVKIGREWQRYEVEFTATLDDDNARLHVDLGGSKISVELAAAGLFMEDGSPAPSGIQFGALRRVTPISRVWGFDRGTPIDRYYIEKFLTSRASDVRGRVLEIGDAYYTRRFGGDRVTCSDVLNVAEGNPETTIVGDLADAPHIPDGSFDCIILTQTLQLIYDVHAALRTLHRILKPGGALLATFPGISQNNDKDWNNDWYWCFTPLAARRMFGEVFPASNVEMEAFGNVLAASSFLYGLSAGELTGEELDYKDRGYEVTIGVRAIKPAAANPIAVRTTGEAITSSGKALILMYHRIGEVGADPFSLSVAPQHFAQQMEVIRSQARVLSLQELTECVSAGRIPDGSVTVTFDDGYADNLHCAKPLLDRHGIPATVFVTTGNLGMQREFWWDALERILLNPGSLPDRLELSIQSSRHRWEFGEEARYTNEAFRRHRDWRANEEPPTKRHSCYLQVWRLLQPLLDSERQRILGELTAWSGCQAIRPTHRALEPEEVAALAGGGLIEIGAHSVTHPVLSDLTAAAQRQEIRQSKRRLEEILGSPVTSFAYPYGALSPETAAIAGAEGLERACSTVPRIVSRAADCLRLPRVQVCDWDADQFSVRLAGWFEGKPAGKEVCQ